MNTRKNSLIKIAAISFLLTIFWSAFSYAQPNITSFSGSLTDGSTITINGNSFGANGPNILIFDDFEGGTNGANIKIGAGSATIGEWTSVTYINNTPPKYSNAHSLSGSLAFRGDATANSGDNNGSGTTAFKCLNNVCGVSGPTTSDIFVSYWYYFPTTSDWPCLSGINCNNKLVWVTGSGTGDDDRVIPTNLPSGKSGTNNTFYPACNDCVGGEPQFYPQLTMSKGKWYRFWVYLHGAGNATDHEELWVASPSSEANIAAATRINRTTQIWNTTFNGFNRVMINGFNRWCNDCAESAPTFDDVYVAIGTGARARVEIGDAATYATNKNLTIATVTSWSDTSITATIRQGSFSNLNNAYLYVIDADGNVNTDGYLLSDGGGGGGATPPPPSSSSGGDTSSSSGGSGCGFVKDNGKGQGAKDEGLALILMLIITLTIIYLIRRGKAMSRPIKFLLFISFINLIFILIFVSSAMAVESFCPGGSSTDSNVVMCDDFEDGTSKDSWAFEGYPPEYGEAVRCDNNSFGFQDKCSAYSGDLLHFDGSWGYQNHYGERYLPTKASEHTELYLRMYIYFSNPYTWGNTGDKGIYFRRYDAIGTETMPSVKISYSNNGIIPLGTPSFGSDACASYSVNSTCPQNQNNTITFQPGRWYLIEFYFKLNDPGVANGIAKFWIDDASVPIKSQTLRLSYNNLMLRDSTFSPSSGYNALFLTLYHQRCDLGSACPSTISQWVKWDNIVVSKTPIGPMGGGGGGGNTPPSSSSSGGDASASGGSGCGFVKDDGKGQKAKGEGLSFAMMLIIILAGIALVRKVAINKGSKGVEHIKKMICLMSYSKCIWFLIMVIASTALVNTSHAAVLVDENFDDSSYADTGWTAWLQNGNCNTGTTMAISSNAAYRGSAGLDIYYQMGDNPRGDCQLHQDNNTSLVHTFSPGMSHYFVRGYFRFPFNTTTLCSTPVIQRKLIYFKPQNYNSNGWNFIVNAWPWINCSTDGYNVSVTFRGPTGSDTLWGNGSPGFFPTNNHLYVNTWYYIEAEVEYGAYGQDTMRIWLAPAGTSPSLIFERTDLTFRSEQDVAGGITLGTVEIGRQVDIVRDSFSQGIDEHRYWDEIVISTTPIGPVDGGSGGNTPPPSSGSSGGDSGGGSSGGSGCGFVKEDGKGQKAKGEGLVFAVMLIIALSGIAIRRMVVELKMRRAFFALIKGLCFLVVAILFAQIAACGSGGGGDSSNSSNSSSGGSGGGTNNGAATINMVLPQENSVGAALDTYITLQSSAPLNPGTVSASTFYITALGNSLITATVSYQNQAITIRPQSALQPLTTYSVVCANGVKDANGLDVSGHTWSFTTTNAAGNPLPLMGLWESQMVTAGNKWGLFLQSPNNSFDAKLNAVYYDSERTFYQISTYLGQAEPWNSYAQAAETVFRDGYFIPNTYHIPGYYRFPDGLYLDWLRNGDTTSAAGLVLMRDNPACSDPDTSPFAYAWYWHRFSREIAYAIGANVLAERAGNPRQTARMQLYIPMALNHLKEWRTQQFGDPDVTQHFFQPFMFGLTADALIAYYEWEVEQGHNPDETIPNAIKATVDWMWTAPVVDQPGKVMWIPDLGGTGGAYTDTGGLGFGGFRYADRTYTVSGGGGPAPAPDLNLLIAPAYAWLYKHFGDPAYRDKGDLIWKGGVAPASADWSGKLFNQQYRLSFNYVKWRQEGLAKWGN